MRGLAPCFPLFAYTTLFRSDQGTRAREHLQHEELRADKRSTAPRGRDLPCINAPRQSASLHHSAMKRFAEAHLYMEGPGLRSEEHTSELQSLRHLVCRLLLE